MPSATWFFPSLRAAFAVGRKNYDHAIALMQAQLTGSKSDAWRCYLIAQYYKLAGQQAQAASSALQALALDERHFLANKFLADHYADCSERDQAMVYIRRALECYMPDDPQPLKWYERAIATFFRLIGRPDAAQTIVQSTVNPNQDNDRWMAWAKRYLLER
jgi:tetratricopeptide (TPR) repeat protein